MMTSPTDAKPEVEVWELPLVTLFDVLSQEAFREAGKWKCRKLPRGALVCVILEPVAAAIPQRFVVRIARATKPETASEWAAWERELSTFERFMQLSDPPWERVDDTRAAGVAMRYVERAEGMDEPDRDGR